MKQTVENLLGAPYPSIFEHQQHKTIYQQSDECPTQFHCNFCDVNLTGEGNLLHHNGTIGHQAAIQKQFTKMLNGPTTEKYILVLPF